MRKVLYSGIFDLLHTGHLAAINYASTLGDYLVIQVAGDQETKMVKGDTRPIIPIEERATMLANLKMVNEVVYKDYYWEFEDVVRQVKPDIVLMNLESDYPVEEAICRKYGISIAKIPRMIAMSGLDTTQIINKIKDQQTPTQPVGINYILRYGSSILLQRRDDQDGIRCPGMLAIPGGAIDKGESAPFACAREIKEETGQDIAISRLRYVKEHTYSWGDHNRVFSVITTSNEVVSKEGKLEWYMLSKISPEDLADNQGEILKEYARI